MVFSSILFMFIYLPVVLALYYLSPLKWRCVVLFVVNLIFYGWGEPIYVSLMIFSTLVDYVFGMLVDKYRSNDKLARRFVLCSVIVNLGLLFFFKYIDFFIANLALIQAFSSLKPLGVSLPIGISFYTFQTMSYTIDVYRNDAPVQKNIIKFGDYVSLFPQLIAGPIVRYKDVAEQLNEREHSVEKFASGVRRFIVGLAKKVLLANNIGMLWDVYKVMPAEELTTLGAWLGIIAFSFQIYFDFSGYSDMAIGLGRMIGFEFLENFNYPYISKSITEFWRRWHISLGTWFREYVYIPLGGNRKGTLRTFLNIFIVWAITGFWHGASWNYLLWGIYYAILLMIEKAFLLDWLKKAPAIVSHLYTLVLVVIGWALFAIEDLGSCITYISAMLGGGAGFTNSTVSYYFMGYLPSLIIMAFASTPLGVKLLNRLPVKSRQIAIPVLIAFTLLISTAYLVDATYNPFLYFRF